MTIAASRTCIQAGHSRLTGAQNQWPRRAAIGSSAARVGPQRRVGRHQDEKPRRGLVEIGRLHRPFVLRHRRKHDRELLRLWTAATTQASPSFEEHDERRHEPGHPRRQALDEPALHPHPGGGALDEAGRELALGERQAGDGAGAGEGSPK